MAKGTRISKKTSRKLRLEVRGKLAYVQKVIIASWSEYDRLGGYHGSTLVFWSEKTSVLPKANVLRWPSAGMRDSEYVAYSLSDFVQSVRDWRKDRAVAVVTGWAIPD